MELPQSEGKCKQNCHKETQTELSERNADGTAADETATRNAHGTSTSRSHSQAGLYHYAHEQNLSLSLPSHTSVTL
ncbi:uncharacterized protein DS421_4g107900 [Arachis hypogaea]|nr:uncharacterized protein DS421_4g107900 [Arachis hypogaea]